MEFSRDDLEEAKRQIDSTLHKLRKVIITLESKENAERYKSQITLAKRCAALWCTSYSLKLITFLL